MFIESGGDNLAATFSPELADVTLYVIDVAAGDKIPRKGGPGITRSDLLVINKIDLAPHVGASLEIMDRDARRMRGTRPFLFTDLKAGKGVAEVAAFICRAGGLEAATPPVSRATAMTSNRRVSDHVREDRLWQRHMEMAAHRRHAEGRRQPPGAVGRGRRGARLLGDVGARRAASPSRPTRSATCSCAARAPTRGAARS